MPLLMIDPLPDLDNGNSYYSIYLSQFVLGDEVRLGEKLKLPIKADDHYQENGKG